MNLCCHYALCFCWIRYLFRCLIVIAFRNTPKVIAEATSVVPRERPKSKGLPLVGAEVGLPIQTSITPRQRPAAGASSVRPATPSGWFSFVL